MREPWEETDEHGTVVFASISTVSYQTTLDQDYVGIEVNFCLYVSSVVAFLFIPRICMKSY